MANSPSACLLCQKVVKAKERRVIRSTKNAGSILLQYLSDLQPSSQRTILHDGAVICRPCLRSIDKLHNLKEETKKIDDDIRQKMGRVMEPYLLQDQTQVEDSMQFSTPEKCASTSQETTPTSHRRKRARTVEEAELFIPTSKRGHYDTPTRTTLQNMVPGASPAVAVSAVHACVDSCELVWFYVLTFTLC